MKINTQICKILSILILSQLYKVTCIENSFNNIFSSNVVSSNENQNLIVVDIDILENTHEIQYIYDSYNETHTVKAIPPRLIRAVLSSGVERWSASKNRYPDALYIKFDSSGEPTVRAHYPGTHIYKPSTAPPERQSSPPIPTKPPDTLHKSQELVADQYPNSQNKRIVLTESKLIILNLNNKHSTNKIIYEKQDENTHFFIANEPYFIKAIVKGNQTIWASTNDQYPVEVMYQTPPGVKPLLELFYPPDDEKPIIPPKPTPQELERRQVVDITNKFSTDKIDFRIHEDGFDIFTPVPPSVIDKVSVGPSIAWRSRDDYYPNEVVSFLDENGKPYIQVICPIRPLKSPLKSKSPSPQPQTLESKLISSEVPSPKSDISKSLEGSSESVIIKPPEVDLIPPQEPIKDFVSDKSSRSPFESPKGSLGFEDIQISDLSEPEFIEPSESPEPTQKLEPISLDVKIMESTDEIEYHYDSVTNTHTFTPKYPHVINVVNKGSKNVYTHESGNYPEKVVVFPGPEDKSFIKVIFPENKSLFFSDDFSYESMPNKPFDPKLTFDFPNRYYFIQECLGDFDYVFKPEGKCTRVTFDGIDVWKKGDFQIDDPTGVRCNRSENQIFVRDRNKIVIYIKDIEGKWNYYNTVNIKYDFSFRQVDKSDNKSGTALKSVPQSDNNKSKGMDIRIGGVKAGTTHSLDDDQSEVESVLDYSSDDTLIKKRHRNYSNFKPRGYRTRWIS